MPASLPVLVSSNTSNCGVATYCVAVKFSIKGIKKRLPKIPIIITQTQKAPLFF